jgi:hypothetical protein
MLWVYTVQILDYFSTQSPSLSTHFFPPLHQTLLNGQVSLFAEVSELFTQNVFQVFIIHKMVAKEGGAKMTEVTRA